MPSAAASELAREDVVLIRFPFTDLSGDRLRPAVVVGRPIADDVLVAFVTSRPDVMDAGAEHALVPEDREFAMTGLKVASRVRLNKLATLHRALVRRRLGRVGPRTRRAMDQALRDVLDL